MKETKKPSAPAASLFSKENYTWMIAGIILVALGILLMAGGKSDDPMFLKKMKCTAFVVSPSLPFLFYWDWALKCMPSLKSRRIADT